MHVYSAGQSSVIFNSFLNSLSRSHAIIFTYRSLHGFSTSVCGCVCGGPLCAIIVFFLHRSLINAISKSESWIARRIFSPHQFAPYWNVEKDERNGKQVYFWWRSAHALNTAVASAIEFHMDNEWLLLFDSSQMYGSPLLRMFYLKTIFTVLYSVSWIFFLCALLIFSVFSSFFCSSVQILLSTW